MGWMDFLQSGYKAGGVKSLFPKDKKKQQPMSQADLNSSLGMMNNMVQGKNPYTGQPNDAPKQQVNPNLQTSTSVKPNAGPQNMPTPGKNGYTPTTAPYGMDQTNPGVQEQFWNQNQNLWTKGAFQGPGQGEQFWNQVAGNFNTAGGNGNLQPQFDAAYDRAKEKAVGTANQQAAARGVYGSSAALNNVGNVAADIEAARAKEATNFALANAANQRSQLGQYGDLAFRAQDANIANRGFDLNSLNSAYNASGAAQGQRDQRIQNQFGNTMAMTGMYMPFLQNNYDQLLGTDMGLVTGAQEAKVGSASNAVAQQQANRQQNSADLSNGLALYGAFKPSPAPASPGGVNPGYSPNYGGYARVY